MQTLILDDGAVLVIPEGATVNQTPQVAGLMTVTINGATLDRLVVPQGGSATVKITSSLPVTADFAVPLIGLYGAHGRTLTFSFVNGIAEREVSFPVSGEWEVTEESINTHLPHGAKFSFAGLKISVSE